MSALFNTKYRPTTLDDMIGHEQAVTRIKGMIAKKAFPSALLITGPTSVGKTTIAQALAQTINGQTIDQQKQSGVYKETNGASDRSIEDIRDLIKLSKFKPLGQSQKRIILIDEAQGIVTNKPAAQALLKPIEDSGKTDTIWILCSMDPAKFQSTTDGKALLNRCVQIVLKPHTTDDKLAFAKRIVKSEKMGYLKDLDLLRVVADRAEGMRDVANQLQALGEYVAGLDKAPAKLTEADLTEALSGTENEDDKLAATICASALTGKFTQAQLAILDMGEAFQVVNKMVWIAQFLLNLQVLDGKKHRKVWWAPANRMAHAALKSQQIKLGTYAAFLEMCVQLKNQSMTFTVDAQALISSMIYRFIRDNLSKKE